MKLSSHLRALPAPLLLLTLSTWISPVQPERLDNGLIIEPFKSATCSRPTKDGDTISVHYKGVLEGEELPFDSSYSRNAPFTFTLGASQVIKGWDEGLLGMCVGEERKLTIPPELGYGNRNVGPIPAGSTLVFTTELMRIAGVPAEEPSVSEEETDGVTSVADGPTSTDGEDGEHTTEVHDTVEDLSKGSEDGPKGQNPGAENGECRLLGPFALVVQSALGLLALLSLVFKRWRERPRRPIKVWFFDVSKQVLGTALLHVFNIFMSTFSSGSGVDAASRAHSLTQSAKDEHGRMPNPCSFYLLNLAIDTTIGVPVLLVFLKVLHACFLKTPLASPPESIKSGHYGQPPQVGWWIKQSFIYFLGLLLMKLFVFFLFAALPWLPWVGDWALRWTEGNESLQIAFVMFIFPLAMNMIQYYVIDMFIKEKDQGAGQEGYQSVRADDDSFDSREEEERTRVAVDDEEDDEGKAGAREPRVQGGDEASSSKGTPPGTADAKDADR